MLGLEVEAVEKLDGDVVFEINVTPNRPDCLSVIGIAREIATAMNLPLKHPKYEIKEEASDDGLKVEILDAELCHRYAGRVIKGVRIEQSPDWIKNRIAGCGIRAINNIVDITNYVLMESGHPLHAFDLNKLKGKSIKAALAEEDCSIVTLDGIERKLPPDALLIWDAKILWQLLALWEELKQRSAILLMMCFLRAHILNRHLSGGHQRLWALKQNRLTGLREAQTLRF